MEAFDRLSPALQYQVVNGLGWTGLRPVQEQSTHAILDGTNCVILAPTAGGKTEAALLPLLSRMNTEDFEPVSVLYVAPIRALLNNQESRLRALTALVGRTAGKWHGDVGQSARKRMLKARPDILAITPESLEAMFLSTRVPPQHMLGNVRAIIIDEVHAFAADDRGSHLVSLIERITRLSGHDIQRIGLSATVGDPDDIVGWLSGSSMRPTRVIDPGGAKREPKLMLDHVGSLENAALLIDRMYPGTRRLVFVDSRRGVERLGHALAQRDVDVYLSHSSLALSERAAAEAAFTEGSNCVIVATSALELGLDVGDLDHVIQIDAPSTVSSFLQRMGRTGRRAGTTANCTFLCIEEDEVLQAAALLELHARNYVEPAAASRWAPHVLAQQLIALAMQQRGVPTLEWWTWLEGCSAFAEVTGDTREAVARHMLREAILTEVDHRLVLGDRGQKLYGAKNFLELYAVFSTPRVLRVLHGAQEIGMVDAFFLQDEDRRSAAFVLAGRPWRILNVNWKAATCEVEPAEHGVYPRWYGRPTLLSRALCQAMRDVLVGDDVRPWWSKRASAAIQQLRESHGFLREAPAPLTQEPDGSVKWWTYAGGRGNRLLAAALQSRLGDKVTAGNEALRFSGDAAKSDVAIRQTLRELADGPPLTWTDAAGWTDASANARVSKFQPCLPELVEQELVARELMDVNDAAGTLRAWRSHREEGTWQ
ncbi:MAG: DEAD/DEAH box helicase [Myxococcales bacterium]|nr:DEAD/DEAH box helicase [Myxococcales bacterium]